MTEQIAQSVDFGGSSITGPSDDLGASPPLPPLAERWARTAVERSSPGPVGHPLRPKHGGCLDVTRDARQYSLPKLLPDSSGATHMSEIGIRTSGLSPYVALPAELESLENLGISEYQRAAKITDRMRPGIDIPILGLFGEVGSLLAALKKQTRDHPDREKYAASIKEELGDTLWYLANIASRTDQDLDVLAQRTVRSISDWDEVQPNFGTFDDIQSNIKELTQSEFEAILITLAGRVGDLVKDLGSGALTNNRDRLSGHLVDIFGNLLTAADAARISLGEAATANLLKVFSRWPLTEEYPPLIDDGMPDNEQIPRKFEILIEERKINGKIYVQQKLNGVIIGDRLTDNKREKDDFRFHDVFHMSYAVFLGWSPVLRNLLHLKRKSDPIIDENEDGARALLIEEGVSTFIFQRAIDRDFFKGQTQVDYDLLKSIRDFTRGFEVDRCALWQWEKAILEACRIFSELKRYRKGYIAADLISHTLEFRRVPEDRRED
ncbi:NTP pyrophosphatase (non-canonical NTP hydrolase) [Azospirillum lipoferum]|nr:NTP pyrophosphatase (non-canonical NTP hydrolase) [Azospirillum lipoferum]